MTDRHDDNAADLRQAVQEIAIEHNVNGYLLSVIIGILARMARGQTAEMAENLRSLSNSKESEIERVVLRLAADRLDGVLSSTLLIAVGKDHVT